MARRLSPLVTSTTGVAILALLVTAVFSGHAAAQSRAPRDLARLVEQGDAALDEQRYGEAFDAFAAAAKLAPADASLRLGAGFAAAMLGQLREARAWLDGALKIDPKYTEASVVLGQVLYREGNVAEAVAAYEAALKYKPGDEGLTRLLEQWRKESQLHSRFYETRGAHFSVIVEGPADDIAARRIVDFLEQAYYRIGSAMNVYPADTIPVVLYTMQQFRDVTRTPAWTGAIYDGRIKLPAGGALADTDALKRTLDHEFVHALVASVAGTTVPFWLNEGLATVLEPGGLDWTNDLLRRESGRLPFARLERSFSSLPGDQALLAYAQSARAVKKMIDLRGMPAVVSLLQALGRGVPFPSAFQQSIFMRYEDFVTTVSFD
jgi:tetratricopeptide (TPR) repeat protein